MPLDLLCIVEDVPTHLTMNVSSHHTGDVIGYMLQIKLKNTFFFCSSEIYLQGFCSKLYIYTQELKGCDGINWLGIPVNDLYNI